MTEGILSVPINLKQISDQVCNDESPFTAVSAFKSEILTFYKRLAAEMSGNGMLHSELKVVRFKE
jgi:hypothetical protein